MSWLQISFEVSPDSASGVSDLLTEAGALAVTLQDAGDEPVLEPAPGATPLWPTTRVVGLFAGDVNAESVLDRLRGMGVDHALPPHRVEHLEDQPWQRLCMDEFRPMRFGERLWVCPSWTVPPQPEAVSVRLDPGLAFGTGTHPTTALCLEWLAELPLGGLQLLDYGCGSGILAIAGLKLGACRAWAVDTDPQALEATRRNAVENGVHEQLITVPPRKLEAVTTEVLVANILAGPIVDLAPMFATHVSRGGRIGLSGVLGDQAAPVRDCYQRWFEMNPTVYRDDWCLLTGQRRAEEPA